jgi:capsid protein
MTGFGGGLFDAAGTHPLLQDWATWLPEPERVWAESYSDLADRGLSLACNDPYCAALAGAVVMGTIGPAGLRSTSMWDESRDEAATSDRARNLRRVITAITDGTWDGTDLDAEGIRTRRDLEQALCWSAFVLGEGIAVRVPGIDGRSAWRIVDPKRVKNPGGAANSETLRDGFTLAGGRVTGIWVALGKVGNLGVMRDAPPQWIPWTAQDGTPNVLHRTGFRLPGMIRGVSRLAPAVIMMRQLNGVLESHVAGKRLQAIQAMIVEAEDAEAYKAAMENGTALGSPAMRVEGPLNVWIKPPASKVDFPDVKFNGADLKDYLITVYKILSAANQVPVDVVLCQMGEASLSSARAGLDQFDRTCQTEQGQHIAQVTEPMDRVAIADAWARGDIDMIVESWRKPAPAKYDRPPKYSTDRLKDANTIKELRAAGVSGTTAFQMFGLSWEDERELVRAEAEFDAAQGNGDPEDPEDDPAEPVTRRPDQSQPGSAGAWWRRALSWARFNTRGAA